MTVIRHYCRLVSCGYTRHTAADTVGVTARYRRRFVFFLRAPIATSNPFSRNRHCGLAERHSTTYTGRVGKSPVCVSDGLTSALPETGGGDECLVTRIPSGPLATACLTRITAARAPAFPQSAAATFFSLVVRSLLLFFFAQRLRENNVVGTAYRQTWLTDDGLARVTPTRTQAKLEAGFSGPAQSPVLRETKLRFARSPGNAY